MNTDYIPDNIIKDANTLKINFLQSKEIREHVILILRCINEEINTGFNNGESEVNYIMPFVYGIKNMDEQTAHREICSRILDYLQKKNYRVTYLVREKGRMLKIKWSDYNKEDLKNYQNNIIRRHKYASENKK